MSDRVIRQEVWFSESFESLSSDAFRLFVALTNAADDYGLLEVSYGAIKRAAPLRTWSAEGVAKLLGELAAAGLILPYEVDSKSLAAISPWQSRVNSEKPRHPIPPWGLSHCLRPTGFKSSKVKAAASALLGPVESPFGARALPEEPAIASRTTDGPPAAGSGYESTHRPSDAAVAPPRGAGEGWTEGLPSVTRLPKNWRLPDDWGDWAISFARQQGHSVSWPQVQIVADSFRDYWSSKSGKEGLRTNWRGPWRNWFRLALDDLPRMSESMLGGETRDTIGRGI
jgi:hypothetical protein